MDQWLSIINVILFILIILLLIVFISLYFTGTIHLSGPTGPMGFPGVPGTASNTGATGPRGMVGQQGIQGPLGPTGVTGPTGLSGLQDFAFVSFSQAAGDGELELAANANMPFNQADVNGAIGFVNNNTLILQKPGYYQVNFGYGNIKPGEFVTQSFSLIVNGAAPVAYYTLQEQINISAGLRYDRGGQGGSVIVHTTTPNQTLQLRNTLNHAISFLNETSPVAINNVGALSAWISVVRVF